MLGQLARGRARSLARHVSTSSIIRAAQPVAVEQTSSGGGFLSRIFGGGPHRLEVPMTEAIEVEAPYLQAAPSQPPATELTTLPNGVRVATENTLGPTTTVGIFVNAGSVYETPEQTGASHLLEYMAFKSTKNRTFFRLTREIEAMGANVMASASREQIVYNVDAVKTLVPDALEVLADAVLNPVFHNWEVKEQRERLLEHLKSVKDNPQTLLLEGLHEVAYRGGLAKPLLCPEASAHHINEHVLEDFFHANFTAPRIVLAGSGVEHKALVAMAEPLMSAAPGGSSAGEPSSEYVGGDYRQFLVGPMTHIMLGFEFAGGWRDVKGACVGIVLQYLLGGGGSFSSGGPGKGMHSRLYRRVLNHCHWVSNCTAFNSMYNDTGVFGVFISGESTKAADMVDAVTRELQAVAKEVPQEELDRAKNTAISSILMNLESRAVVAEDLGRQVLTYGKRYPTRDFISQIEKLTPGDVTKAVSKMLKTPVSMASLGNIADVPRYAEMQKRFA